MSPSMIDWSELSLQIVITFGHFLWQGLVVALLLVLFEYLRLQAQALRSNAKTGKSRDGSRRSANFAYVMACIAFFALPCCVVSTFFWVHQTRGSILVALSASESTPAIGESVDDDATETAGSTAMVSAEVPPALPELNAVEIPVTEAPSQQRVEREFLSTTTQSIKASSPYLCLAYLVGVAWMLGRFGLSLVGGARLHRTLEPIADANVLAMISNQARKLGLRRIPLAAICQRVSVPAVVGILQPAILLPPVLLSGLDPQQLAAILSHELAHIRRHDLMINLLQRFVEALLFFHPVTWWISRRVRVERENCCDDVAAAGSSRIEYALALLRMAEQCATLRGLNIAPQLESLAADGGDGSQLGYRIRRLLGEADSPRVSVTRNALAALTLAACFIGMAVIAIAQTDQKPQATDGSEVETSETPEDGASITTSGANAKVELWEISKLYEAAFLRTYLQDHETLPKPIVVPPVSGKVFDPNGNPASGVRIVSHTPRHWVDLDATLALKPHNSGGVRHSKQDGTFGLPERTEPYRVLLVHESGVANVSHEELLRAKGKVTLNKWASLSGTLKLGGKPQAGETIVLHFDTLPWSYSRGGPRLTTTHKITTDKDGIFSFVRVPPLGGMAHHLSRSGSLEHGTVYQCESGRNTHMELGAGNTITGKLSFPKHVEKKKLKVYARNHLLPIPYPEDWTDEVNKEERRAWRIKWSSTAEGCALEDKNFILMNSNVPGSITDDGRFTVYGVPERPMVLVVAIPGEAILLEQPFDCTGSANDEMDLGTLTVADDHDHDHDEVNQIGKSADKAQLPKLIVKTVDSDGKPVPGAAVLFYDRNSHRAGQKQKFEMVNKRTDESGVADFGVIPNSFGCLQLSPSNNEFAGCYTLISTTMTKCTQAKPPRANVQTEIKDGILTVTFTMTPHVDLEFNIVDDATDEIVFWSEIFYQDPTSNRWWQFGLVDGSKTQHNFIPISPQITNETIRISALGYETKVFRLPDELDRSKPIRRDVRLKPMPDVELEVLLVDGAPAEKAKLTFHYPSGLDCLEVHDELSDAQGIITTKFPPSADIGILRIEHTGGTAELSMKELLDDAKQNPGKVIRRSIQLKKSKKQNTAVTAETLNRDDHTKKPVSWIPARPLKTTVSTGSARVLDDHSVGREGDVTWQEPTSYFAFNNSTTLDELRLELLPVDSPAGPQFGRGGEKLILSEVTARLEKPTGESTIHEFSSCVSLLNPDDDITIHCIDFLSDTGWTVPALPADAEAHSLVLRFDEPVTLQPGERLVLSVDSGGAKEFAVLNRIRFAFHHAATETGTVVLHAIDADTGEPIRDVEFVKENAVGEDWATPVGRSDADGTVRIETKALPGYFFSILHVPQGYKVTSLDEVPAHVEVGRRVDYRFHLRKLGTNLEFVKNVPESNAAGNRFAEALKETNQKSLRIVIDDMPGFRAESVTFSFAREKAPLAERIFANGELVRAAVTDELRYFEKAEGNLAGKISKLDDIQVVISSSTLPRAPATPWYLHCRTRDGIELKQDGFRVRFEDLDHWDLEIPSFLHPEF